MIHVYKSFKIKIRICFNQEKEIVKSGRREKRKKEGEEKKETRNKNRREWQKEKRDKECRDCSIMFNTQELCFIYVYIEANASCCLFHVVQQEIRFEQIYYRVTHNHQCRLHLFIVSAGYRLLLVFFFM